MAADPDAPGGLTPRDYLRIGRRWWWLLAGLPILFGLVGFTLANRETKVFESTVGIRFRSGQVAESESTGSAKNASTVNREVETEVEVIDPKYRPLVLKKLQISDQELRDVRVRAVADTNFIEVTVATDSKPLSAKAAQAYGQIYVAEVKAQERTRAENRTAALGLRKGALENSLNEITQRIAVESERFDQDNRDRLAAGLAPLPQSQVLNALESQRNTIAAQYQDAEGQYAALLASALAAAPSSEIVANAQPGDAPVSPRPLRAGIVGFILGLLLALVATIGLEFVADRVRTRADVERFSGLPVLAWVPRTGGGALGRPVTLAQPSSARAEAYRTLRATVQFVRMRGPLNRIVVAGLASGDGNESTAANLGVTLAASGARVMLVDADLRGGRVHDRFGLRATPGLTDVLLGTEPLDAVIREVEVPGGHLALLPAGTRPPISADLVALEAFETLLDKLARDVEVVVVSAPPLLDSADAIALATRSDGIILVATARRTRRRQLGEASARLRRVGASALGVVLEGKGSDDASFDPSIGEVQTGRRTS